MKIYTLMIDLDTDGAMPVECDIKREESNIILKLIDLNIELAISSEDIMTVMSDDLHG